MKRMLNSTQLEIWDAEYINNPSKRAPEDKNARILQIEAGSDKDEYIVEVVKVCTKE